MNRLVSEYVCECAYMGAGAPGGQKRVLNSPSWSYRNLCVLGAKLESYTSAASVLIVSHLFQPPSKISFMNPYCLCDLE